MIAMSPRWAGLLALALPFFGVGCSSPFGGHGCLDDGELCDETTLTVLSPDGGWVVGTYDISVKWNADAVACTLQIPAAPTATICGPGTSATAQFKPTAVCDTSCDASACTSQCTSVPGEAQLVITIDAIPSEVDLGITVNGLPVLTQTVAPQVTTSSPNDPECGGNCMLGAASVPAEG